MSLILSRFCISFAIFKPENPLSVTFPAEWVICRRLELAPVTLGFYSLFKIFVYGEYHGVLLVRCRSISMSSLLRISSLHSLLWSEHF